jgi:hypothetical protein
MPTISSEGVTVGSSPIAIGYQSDSYKQLDAIACPNLTSYYDEP